MTILVPVASLRDRDCRLGSQAASGPGTVTGSTDHDICYRARRAEQAEFYKSKPTTRFTKLPLPSGQCDSLGPGPPAAPGPAGLSRLNSIISPRRLHGSPSRIPAYTEF
jgi:hypothetical protein